MKKTGFVLLIAFVFLTLTNTKTLFGQEKMDTVKLQEITVTASRMPVLLKNVPASVSIVNQSQLSIMPKSIAAEEALRLVPGVRIDNQHDAERVHLSIRGQGILTERGLRGIGVLLDGIPLNDPSGFVPDLYDVDWQSVKKIEVLRGPAAGLYGGAAAGGVLNITTDNGYLTGIGGEIAQSLGSNGFRKSFAQIGGSQDIVDYRVSFSRTDGDGYRDHQGFWNNKLYEKVNFYPSDKLMLTQIISHTDYFQQNPEGLNLGQLATPTLANPDASPFNEYQKTNRNTAGISGNYIFNNSHGLQFYSYIRDWKYKETSNKAAEYRDISAPGASLQYNLYIGSENVKHNISIGADAKWQYISMYKLQSAGNPDRKESIDETNIETDSLLANQLINQNSLGLFALYRLEFGRFNFNLNVRQDEMNNELTNKMIDSDTAKTSKDFSETSIRLGAAYNLSDELTLFASWSQGFTPPSTEELSVNPVAYSGFNTHLIPAKSSSSDVGIRGNLKEILYFELTGFYMNTRDDFFRFKQSGRGNQEVFYGNAGNSRRFGLEAYASYNILDNLSLSIAYTYADYQYTNASIDPVYTDTNYVLTSPPVEGQYLPNSPKHQLFSEIVYKISNFTFSLSTEFQSKWAIYTDAKAYKGELDKNICRNWQDGFNLFHARASYSLNLFDLNGEFSVYVRNISGEKYIAFTEPDPDGNSYQPGPEREIFGSIRIMF